MTGRSSTVSFGRYTAEMKRRIDKRERERERKKERKKHLK
jgi:hypothetical protein